MANCVVRAHACAMNLSSLFAVLSEYDRLINFRNPIWLKWRNCIFYAKALRRGRLDLVELAVVVVVFDCYAPTMMVNAN